MAASGGQQALPHPPNLPTGHSFCAFWFRLDIDFRLFSKGGPPDVLSLFSHVFVS